MNDKNTYSWNFDLFEDRWRRGLPCPDCVDESNWRVWKKYISTLIEKHMCAETMETEEFQEILSAFRKEEEQRIAQEEKSLVAAEARKRRKCMERPKIDFVPKGLYVDLEAAYSKYFQQVVTFMPEDRDDFMYMLRLLERWEKKSVPAVLAKGRPDAAYAIAIELCKNLELLLMRGDMEEYIREYKLRIAKLIHASFVALVDSVAVWNNEEKREYVFNYINTHLSRFDDFKGVQKKLLELAPSEKIIGEPLHIEREMNEEETRAAREKELRRKEKERQILEAEKEAQSIIPLNKDYEERIFNFKNVDWDCDTISSLMFEEMDIIQKLLADEEYQTAALMFMQLTKSMCRHFVIDRHWEYFDDVYSPEYTLDAIIKLFEEVVKEGKLPKDVNTYLHEAWKEISDMESCKDYGIPSSELPF